MADIVTVRQIFDGVRYCTYEFTNESDGTGETTVKKIDLDDLVGRNGFLTGGERPLSLSLSDISYEVGGFNYVNLLWDRTPSNILILTIVDSGGSNYRGEGDKHDPNGSMDGTGDILLTTDGGADGSGYRILVKFRKKYK